MNIEDLITKCAQDIVDRVADTVHDIYWYPDNAAKLERTVGVLLKRLIEKVKENE